MTQSSDHVPPPIFVICIIVHFFSKYVTEIPNKKTFLVHSINKANEYTEKTRWKNGSIYIEDMKKVMAELVDSMAGEKVMSIVHTGVDQVL